MEMVIVSISLALMLLVVAVITVRRCVIMEYQRGLLYIRGKFTKVLPPGEYTIFRPIHIVHKIDMRITNVTIPGQEVLTADNIGLKVSLAASYRVKDPYHAVNQVTSYPEALYMLLQLSLRDMIGGLAIDDLLAKREEISKSIFKETASKAAEFGVELLMVGIKDIMFPGDLKNIFAQVVNAREEGLAALERARGESAALRNLNNAAHLFENNPSLQQARLFQVLEKSSGSTVVFLPAEVGFTSKPVEKAAKKIKK
jgi:regulator of protease activity HflC (stomatin/prohibitin superfamily)